MSSFKATEDESGNRIDAVLAARYPEQSRSYWSKALSKSHVTVNGKSVKGGHKLAQDDDVIIQIPETEKVAVDIPVIYEDDNVVVIDKPEGVLVHSNGNFDQEFTVVDFMEEKYLGDSERRGIVHRLDRTTSGVMICAKNDQVATELQLQFAERSVQKEYLAICSGSASEPKAVIDLPIERNPKAPNIFRVGANGKAASTTYEVIEDKGELKRVSLQPKTGRTHQLRVHMAYIGMPIFGDEMYGGKKASRVMLHAHSLTVRLPNGNDKTFTADVPESFGYE